MPMPSSFITRDLVVDKLIRERCKYADSKSQREKKDEFLSKISLSDTKHKVTEIEKEIRSMFPPRKQWRGLGKQRQLQDSVTRNIWKLRYTYQKAKKNHSNELWYLNLCDYADKIVRIVSSSGFGIRPPRVNVIEKKVDKEHGIIECRPVCTFSLKIKIILSLLNKYLTRIFDGYFYDCSHAFRLPNKNRNNLQHLNAVTLIRDYRLSHLDQSLFVAECDMQKFYDTISHRIIKMRFSLLLHRAVKDNKISRDEAKIVKRWFFWYIDCFNFLDNVYCKNKLPSSHPFWRNIKNPYGYECRIKWLNNEDFGDGYRSYVKMARKRKGFVGVPQGGALSGLIANITMHSVDKAVYSAINDKDVLYCRFCDDMILIGPQQNVVKDVFNAYNQAVISSLLVPHPNKTISLEHMKDFWKGKTRGPYEWNEKGHNVFPWITFVGFDINWKGNLRIRAGSFKRQIEKQNKVANDLLVPYDKGKIPRYCSASIKATLVKKLIGMSVGRINLWDYQDNKNIHSWMSAFSILDENPWSSKQLRELDRHRQIVIARACKKISKIRCTNKKQKGNTRDQQRTAFIYSGSPFSYYGQCFIYKNKKSK